ncbi:M2 family metallopeptidase [Paenibacillus elgii]|uniref:M2 family metallopeptidase n=1 Tax=Paenibacillus elgii TaxID=189691 RepID=UPI00204222C6|nr:M2 family metallopeptidase [Paenibacillus elgii]MCM3272136.1 M2 family metallopeptidase [Paenibacillus elgii]
MRTSRSLARYAQDTNDLLRSLYSPMMHALWMVMTTGEWKWVQESVRHEKAYQKTLSSPLFRRNLLRRMDDNSAEPLLRRQLDVLRREMLEHRASPVKRERMASLWNDLHYTLATFRAEVNGALLSEHSMLVLLRSLRDTGLRRKVWLAGMRVGASVAPRLIELVTLRNEVAVKQGFANFYEMKLYAQETEPRLLEELIRTIRRGLDGAYRREKERIDEELAETFRVSKSALRSWHYAHPFVQSHNPFLLGETIEPDGIEGRVASWLHSCGFDIGQVLLRSDTAPRSGKSQANCCLNVNRGDDIRLSCHLTPDRKGLSLFLHELGHAVYEQEIDSALPFLLHQPAHPLLSEGTALLFERLAWDRGWLQELNGGISFVSEEQDTGPALRRELLVKLYWTMTVIEFEKRMYENPRQPLNRLWWETVEQIQGIPRPEEWDFPYWAAKAHLTTLPVHYYNYLLGEVAASQFQHELTARFGTWRSAEALGYLRDNVFRPGAARPWTSLLADGFSGRLDPLPLIRHLQNTTTHEERRE